MANPFPTECARKYRPERLLASGGFGSVYLANQVDLNRPVAVKILHSEVLHDPSLVARFHNEARIAATLAHPNVVMVIDHGVEGGSPWIVYEYVPGPSLRDRLQDKGRMPVSEGLRAVHQVAEALSIAHQKGILHRDIKPENILEASPGHYKLTDFGIAKWSSEGAVKTQADLILGTPAYLAPEQILGKPPGPHSDLYSLGVVLFELLTGQQPYQGNSQAVLLKNHLEAPIPVPSMVEPGLPPSVDRLVQRALAKVPADRFLLASDLIEAIDDCLSSLEERTGRTTVEIPLRRSSMMRTSRAAMTAVQSRSMAVRIEPKPRFPLVLAILAFFVSIIGIGIWVRSVTLSRQPKERKPVASPAIVTAAQYARDADRLSLLFKEMLDRRDRLRRLSGLVGHDPAELVETVHSLHSEAERAVTDVGRLIQTISRIECEAYPTPIPVSTVRVRALACRFLCCLQVQETKRLQDRLKTNPSQSSRRGLRQTPAIDDSSEFGLPGNALELLERYGKALPDALIFAAQSPKAGADDLTVLLYDIRLVASGLRRAQRVLSDSYARIINDLKGTFSRMNGTMLTPLGALAWKTWEYYRTGQDLTIWRTDHDHPVSTKGSRPIQKSRGSVQGLLPFETYWQAVVSLRESCPRLRPGFGLDVIRAPFWDIQRSFDWIEEFDTMTKRLLVRPDELKEQVDLHRAVIEREVEVLSRVCACLERGSIIPEEPAWWLADQQTQVAALALIRWFVLQESHVEDLFKEFAGNAIGTNRKKKPSQVHPDAYRLSSQYFDAAFKSWTIVRGILPRVAPMLPDSLSTLGSIARRFRIVEDRIGPSCPFEIDRYLMRQGELESRIGIPLASLVKAFWTYGYREDSSVIQSMAIPALEELRQRSPSDSAILDKIEQKLRDMAKPAR